jgi:hypothetical protein
MDAKAKNTLKSLLDQYGIVNVLDALAVVHRERESSKSHCEDALHRIKQETIAIKELADKIENGDFPPMPVNVRTSSEMTG